MSPRFFYLELCQGTLEDYCDGSKYQGRKLEHVDALLHMAEGLAYIHSNKLVHGNIKPNNVLYTLTEKSKSPVVFKISDFALVKETSDRGTLAMSKMKRIRDFMAPEMLHFIDDLNASDTDLQRGSQESDVFALGRVFSFYLSGGWTQGKFDLSSNVLSFIQLCLF
jgi:serine/threonine protein kinase